MCLRCSPLWFKWCSNVIPQLPQPTMGRVIIACENQSGNATDSHSTNHWLPWLSAEQNCRTQNAPLSECYCQKLGEVFFQGQMRQSNKHFVFFVFNPCLDGRWKQLLSVKIFFFFFFPRVWGCLFEKEGEMWSDRGLAWVFGRGDDSCQINGFTQKWNLLRANRDFLLLGDN